jgi:hypothetical protein
MAGCDHLACLAKFHTECLRHYILQTRLKGEDVACLLL